MKKLIKAILLLFITLGAPFTLLAALWLKLVKLSGTGKINDGIFMGLGLLPVLDHYYQPLIAPRKHLKKSLRDDRSLKGIDLNIPEQLGLLASFTYSNELLQFPIKRTDKLEFHYSNASYESGDAEYLYNIVRHFKPARIIEIGSGHSTLMARNAIAANKQENASYTCRHICIEPYEQPWLSQVDVELVREKVEDIDTAFFQQLEKNDILFIDSSHIIRPQGDVLFEFLEVLPVIKPGVLVHVHDIFSPKDYLDEWVYNEHLLWNEQYLLEAFLSFNNQFRVIGALNYLSHHYKSEFAAKCPVYASLPDREPGAFWMIRN